MSHGINKVIIIGNCGKDPEVRRSEQGVLMVKLSVATTDSWVDKAGAKQQKTEWHKVCLYTRLAEIAEQYVKKGSAIYLEGKLRTNKWTDDDGKIHYSTEIVGQQLLMLDDKNTLDELQDDMFA